MGNGLQLNTHSLNWRTTIVNFKMFCSGFFRFMRGLAHGRLGYDEKKI